MKRYIFYIAMAISLGASAQQKLSLQECVEKAKTYNRTLQNAALDIEMAGEQRQEAYTKYFPQISANVMAFQSFDKIIKGDGTVPQEIAMLGEQFAALAGQPIEIRELNRGYSATLSLTQPLYAGGQITTGNRLAALQQDVMQLQRSLKEKDVEQKVTENFWQIAQVKYNLSTLDAADNQLSAVYSLVEQYVKAGVTTRNDLLKVKLRQQELASNRIRLENADHLLRLLLAQQIGMTELSDNQLIDIQLPEGESLAWQMPAKADAASSASMREEYQLANKGVEAEQLQIKMERGKLLPTVAVGAMGYHTGFGGLSSGAKQYVDNHMTNGLVLGVVSVPISDWWGGSHAIKRQKMRLEQARNTALDAREQLTIDIESAWSNLVEASKQIEVAQASVTEAAENLRMSNEQFRAGTSKLTDLLDAETLNRKALNDLQSAQAVYQIRLADYQRKIGN